MAETLRGLAVQVSKLPETARIEARTYVVDGWVALEVWYDD